MHGRTAHLTALKHLHTAEDRVEAARANLRAAEKSTPRNKEAIRAAKLELQDAKQVRRRAKEEEELRRRNTSARHRAAAGVLAVTHAENIVQIRQRALEAARRENATEDDIALATRRLEQAQESLELARKTHREPSAARISCRCSAAEPLSSS